MALSYPKDFVWGVATAAYQIEGAPYLQEGGRSVWDMFCRRPGAVHADENGDIDRKPIVITENGLGNTDWVGVDGQVRDPQRIDFLKRHLRELARAHADGVDIRGYFQWSLMDNFEWNEGYKLRFGLVHVDYQTQRRTPKDSAYWYSEVIKTNGASLHHM